MTQRAIIVRHGLTYKRRTQTLSSGGYAPRYSKMVGEVGGKRTAFRHARRRGEIYRKTCFSDPFCPDVFTWTPSKIKIGDAQLSYISGPSGPLDFATAFDKPAGAPYPAEFKGGGIAIYRIESLNKILCDYLVFKIDAVNIIKDPTGWSKACYGSVGLVYNFGGTTIAIHPGASPGLYYKDISFVASQGMKLNGVVISSYMYTECIDSQTVHHEVNVTFDYIKMSKTIPEGGTQVGTQILT